MPNTFMSIAVDLGDATSPFGDIHPRYKQQVAQRLANAGLAVAYGYDYYWTGPIAGVLAAVMLDCLVTCHMQSRRSATDRR